MKDSQGHKTKGIHACWLPLPCCRRWLILPPPVRAWALTAAPARQDTNSSTPTRSPSSSSFFFFGAGGGHFPGGMARRSEGFCKKQTKSAWGQIVPLLLPVLNPSYALLASPENAGEGDHRVGTSLQPGGRRTASSQTTAERLSFLSDKEGTRGAGMHGGGRPDQGKKDFERQGGMPHLSCSKH